MAPDNCAGEGQGMMKNDLLTAMTQLAAEKGLTRDDVREALEAAIVSAYKRDHDGANVIARLDPASGEARVYVLKRVVETVSDPRTEISLEEARAIRPDAQLGTEVEVEVRKVTPQDFGRIGAQTAKQVILQRLREKERENVYNEYIDRQGDIIVGTVQRVDSRGVILDLGRAEALMPPQEQIPTERYRPGQRLRVYVLEVNKTQKGPQIIVSRAHRDFLKRLFELEVPEIFAGTVELKAIAREPGSRSKVAVYARQEGLDPVGACVGVRGTRIMNIVNELGGEKIDVVRWHADPAVFVANALSPAQVLSVDIDEATRTALVIVPEKQLSLAIGKDGQNARLAAKLTGWRIDIKSDTAARQEAEAAQQAGSRTARTLTAERQAGPPIRSPGPGAG
jgi:N utilization substance protein A